MNTDTAHVLFAQEQAVGSGKKVMPRKAWDCEGVVQKIVSSGGKAIAIGADISKKSDVTASVAATIKQFGDTSTFW